MNSIEVARKIVENAAEITRLHTRIHQTVKHRAESAGKHEEWLQACAEFHARYDSLAFPGGYEGALERISTGDTQTIEAALCFLEVRPYFFRSGYMFKDLLRKCKRVSLSAEHTERLQIILKNVAVWKDWKRQQTT